MATSQILFAGFGGQGILFSGKFLAYNGLIAGKYLSWLPSYGPEMRGGTANCSVILSDTPVGSPIITYPDMLVVMNNPSLDKYEDAVVPGGKIFVDSSLIERKVKRTDVEVFYVPATAMAAENGLDTLANMILVGKLIRESGIVDFTSVDAVLDKIVSAKRAELKAFNKQALDMGYNYVG